MQSFIKTPQIYHILRHGRALSVITKEYADNNNTYLGFLKGQQICSHKACNPIHYIILSNKNIIFFVRSVNTFPKIIFADQIPRITFFCNNASKFNLITILTTKKKFETLRAPRWLIAYQLCSDKPTPVHTLTCQGNQDTQV